MNKKQYTVIETYTLPFIQLVFENKKQTEVFDIISQIKEICDETTLTHFLKDFSVTTTEKERSLRFFQPSGSKLIDNLIEVIILNHREDLFYSILVESQKQIEKKSNEFEVEIKSVKNLSESQRAKLIPIIEKKLGLKVRRLKQNLDEELIGGFVISANNKAIDASIKRQLQVIKENLK